MFTSVVLLALTSLSAFAAPLPSKSSLNPNWKYQSEWVIGIYDAKTYVQNHPWSNGAAQIKSASEGFARLGADYLEDKDISTNVVGKWDSDYMEVVDHFDELDTEEIIELNEYVSEIEGIVHGREFSKRNEGILDHPLWWYQSTFYSALYDAKTYTEQPHRHGSQEDIIHLASEFAHQGAQYLTAKGIQVDTTSAWDAKYASVMDHFSALNKGEVFMLNRIVEDMYEDMGVQYPTN